MDLDREILDVPAEPWQRLQWLLWALALPWALALRTFDAVWLFWPTAIVVPPLVKHLYQRWAAARGAPLVRLGDLIEREYGAWLRRPPWITLSLGTGFNLLISAYAVVVVGLTLPARYIYSPVTPWIGSTAFLLLFGYLTWALLRQRREAAALIAANQASTFADAPGPNASNTAPEPRTIRVPWRLYGSLTIGMLLGLLAGQLALRQGLPDWSPAVFIITGWLAGWAVCLTIWRPDPDWRDCAVGGLGRAVVFYRLYLGLPLFSLMAPPLLSIILTLGRDPLSAQPLGLLASTVTGSLLASLYQAFSHWSQTRTALWRPKPRVAR